MGETYAIMVYAFKCINHNHALGSAAVRLNTLVAAASSLIFHIAALLGYQVYLTQRIATQTIVPNVLQVSLPSKVSSTITAFSKSSRTEPADTKPRTSQYSSPYRARANTVIAAPQQNTNKKSKFVADSLVPQAVQKNMPAKLDAPSAPTAEEWQLAATYTPKNSKRYRYTWAQQVRSMMGTAVAGPEQGLVRFKIEIAPNGAVEKVETVWATSKVAEQRARQAIAALPKLPPMPTGLPLVFEKTISFEPFETGWPPIYKYDCISDPPKFQNQFAWDGKSPQTFPREGAQLAAQTSHIRRPDGCQKDAKPDSLEAESGNMNRQFEQWSGKRMDGAD